MDADHPEWDDACLSDPVGSLRDLDDTPERDDLFERAWTDVARWVHLARKAADFLQAVQKHVPVARGEPDELLALRGFSHGDLDAAMMLAEMDSLRGAIRWSMAARDWGLPVDDARVGRDRLGRIADALTSRWGADPAWKPRSEDDRRPPIDLSRFRIAFEERDALARAVEMVQASIPGVVRRAIDLYGCPAPPHMLNRVELVLLRADLSRAPHGGAELAGKLDDLWRGRAMTPPAATDYHGRVAYLERRLDMLAQERQAWPIIRQACRKFLGREFSPDLWLALLDHLTIKHGMDADAVIREDRTVDIVGLAAIVRPLMIEAKDAGTAGEPPAALLAPGARDEAPPDAGPSLPSGTAGEPPKLSAENRALAVALEMVQAGESLVITHIAKRADCSARYLHKCDKLKAFIKANTGRVRPGRKDRDTGQIEAEDWPDDGE